MHLRVNTDEKLNGFREKDQLVFVFLWTNYCVCINKIM